MEVEATTPIRSVKHMKNCDIRLTSLTTLPNEYRRHEVRADGRNVEQQCGWREHCVLESIINCRRCLIKWCELNDHYIIIIIIYWKVCRAHLVLVCSAFGDEENLPTHNFIDLGQHTGIKNSNINCIKPDDRKLLDISTYISPTWHCLAPSIVRNVQRTRMTKMTIAKWYLKNLFTIVDID